MNNKVANILILLALVLFISFRVTTACNQLDQTGNEITDEHAESYVHEKSPEETSIRQHHNQLKEEGVIFVSNGNEPFWSVQINEEDEIKFQTPESSWTAPVLDVQQNSDEQIYQTETDERSLRISIINEYCQDTMSGFLFTHTVQVQVNDEPEMNGCGRFLE